MNSSVAWGCGTLAVVGIIVLFLILGSGAQVNYGNVGVVSYWGSLDKSQQPLEPGFHVVMPFATHITSVSTQPQNHQFREVAAASKELQNVYVDGGVNYHIATNSAAPITVEGGPEQVVQRVFDPAFQDYIKEVVPQYNTTDILASRSKIRDTVLNRLREKAGPYGMTVDDVFITNIHFDNGYTAAIEKKQESQQQLEQAKIDAQKAVAAAQGQRDSQITQAQGDAEANRLRQQNLTPELIQWLAISKWDGKLPTTNAGNIPFVITK